MIKILIVHLAFIIVSPAAVAFASIAIYGGCDKCKIMSVSDSHGVRVNNTPYEWGRGRPEVTVIFARKHHKAKELATQTTDPYEIALKLKIPEVYVHRLFEARFDEWLKKNGCI